MTHRDFRPHGLFVFAAATYLVLLVAPATAATFFTQQTNASPGQEADVCIWMSGSNDEVAGVQMDLTWDSRCMVPASGNRPRCRSNPDTGKTVQSAARGESSVRAIMLSFSDVEPIPDGELFCCAFRITDNPPEGQCSVSFSNLIASTPAGSRTDARGGRGGAVNITRAGGAPPAPAPGGYEPVPPAASDRPADPAPVAAPQPDALDDTRAAPPRAAGDTAGTGGSAESAGAPGRPAAGDPGYVEQDVGGRPQMGDAMGEAGTAPRAPDAVAAAEPQARAGDDDVETDNTPTPTAEAVGAQATVAPTATPPAPTPTQPQPTATPTASSGWLGGCTLMR